MDGYLKKMAHLPKLIFLLLLEVTQLASGDGVGSETHLETGQLLHMRKLEDLLGFIKVGTNQEVDQLVVNLHLG